MRIIAGEMRGRRLKSLKGENTRPTTDRVREALMSALMSARGTFEGARVLDAFAGSGALGFECLSRGASFVLACEQARAAAAVIEENARDLKLPPARFRLRRSDAFTLPASVVGAFDIVFLDPPYAFEPEKVLGLVTALDEAGALNEGALVCYEHAKKDKQAAQEVVGTLQYELVSVKDYGDTSLVTLRKEAK